jgi:hypothetical protein
VAGLGIRRVTAGSTVQSGGGYPWQPFRRDAGVMNECMNARPQARTGASLPKKDFLHVLRRAGIPQETIRAADEQLHDPVDHERDGIFLLTHGLDCDQLVSRMGGSP